MSPPQSSPLVFSYSHLPPYTPIWQSYLLLLNAISSSNHPPSVPVSLRDRDTGAVSVSSHELWMWCRVRRMDIDN